ncbi:MAG TPA: hypothetical protein VHV49_00550, partial [Pseudonocardiaceae bacterium]|nr:hypothetical protein [Pseudonocardiaceae bacterium]
MTARETTRGRRLREASAEVGRHWDMLRDRVPAPVLRLLVTLPWVLRRMPVPFWVPLALMLLRRIRRRRARRAQQRCRQGDHIHGDEGRYIRTIRRFIHQD